MNNEISNPKTEVPKNSMMNDKDYLTSILSVEKELVKNYATAMTEASNESLHADFKDMLNDADQMQRKTYDLMFKNGWYSLEMADETKVQQELSKLSEEFNELNIKE